MLAACQRGLFFTAICALPLLARGQEEGIVVTDDAASTLMTDAPHDVYAPGPASSFINPWL
jgi:hypothetical protein